MSFKTLAARIANITQRGTTAETLTRLKNGVEGDYDARVQAAEKARAAGIAEVKTAAVAEVQAIEAAVASAKRRAAAIKTLGVLDTDAYGRADKIAHI